MVCFACANVGSLEPRRQGARYDRIRFFVDLHAYRGWMLAEDDDAGWEVCGAFFEAFAKGWGGWTKGSAPCASVCTGGGPVGEERSEESELVDRSDTG